MTTIVFDLDGTLADTSGDLLDAANAALVALGYPKALEHPEDAGTALRGGRAMLTLAFKRLEVAPVEPLIDQGYPLLLEAYGRQIAEKTVLYPGAREVVGRFKTAGYKVAICTNKPIDLAERLLEDLQFRDMWDAVIGANSLPTSKPDPSPYLAAVNLAGGTVERSLIVGDSATDLNTANAVGVPAVLVTFSPAGDSVKALNPQATIDHFDALDRVVAQLL